MVWLLVDLGGSLEGLACGENSVKPQPSWSPIADQLQCPGL